MFSYSTPPTSNMTASTRSIGGMAIPQRLHEGLDPAGNPGFQLRPGTELFRLDDELPVEDEAWGECRRPEIGGRPLVVLGRLPNASFTQRRYQHAHAARRVPARLDEL